MRGLNINRQTNARLTTLKLLGTSSLLALIAAPALGQEAGGTASAEESRKLSTVIVTAQKRTQDLQDVPVAVSAISASDLEAKGIVETSDLMGMMPSLQVTTPYGKTQPNFSLRGVSVANEFSASTASPVGVYVDEVYQSFRASHGQQLYDLDRVEVLRGPQGTLYGRNTTGGAVSLFTRKPNLRENNGYATLGWANYDTYSLETAYEATLVPDKFGIRVAGTLSEGDGWMYNPTQGRDVGTTDNWAARLSARWMPTDNLDINAKFFVARDNPLAPLAYAEGQLAEGRDALGYSRNDPALNGGRGLGEDEVASDTGGNYYSYSEGGALSINYDINDRLSITSITGYDEGQYTNKPFDCDGSPNDMCSIRYDSESKNFNQDIRLTYKGDRFNAVAGIYYGVDEVVTVNEPDFFGVLRPLLLSLGLPEEYGNVGIATNDSIAVLPAFAIDPALTPADAGFCDPITINSNGFLDARYLIAFTTDIAVENTSNYGIGGAYTAGCVAAGALPFSPILGTQEFTVKRPSSAIYADVTYDITDRLTLAAGLRYTDDEAEYKNALTTITDLGGENIIASTIPYSYPYDPTLPRVSLSNKEREFTGRLNLSYQFADDIMGYVNYSRGYRSGSYNGLAYQGLDQVYYIEPELVDAYEVGFKSRLLDGRAQLNAAAFYYDYSNQQFTEVIGATTFTRSGDGTLQGGEIELAFQVADALRFDASMGILKTEYDGNTIDPTDPSSPTREIDGNPFPNAPETTFAAGFDWEIGDFKNGTFTLRGDASYMGEYYFDPYKDYGQSPCDQPAAGFNILQAGPSIACGNPSYWLYNARLTYATPDWSVALWGKNLSDENYYTYGLNINVFGLDYLNRGTPRTYGIEFKKQF